MVDGLLLNCRQFFVGWGESAVQHHHDGDSSFVGVGGHLGREHIGSAVEGGGEGQDQVVEGRRLQTTFRGLSWRSGRRALMDDYFQCGHPGPP